METKMITIDGSMGEGGGQVLRTALALSACTGKAFTIEKIRAKRKKPGLMRQHLTCVHATQEICSAEISGDAISSQQLVFKPGFVLSDDYHFAVGSAGSAMLVLQTVLPPLLLASHPSKVVIEGGFGFDGGLKDPLGNRRRRKQGDGESGPVSGYREEGDGG